jgi:CBS domain-containing protein
VARCGRVTSPPRSRRSASRSWSAPPLPVLDGDRLVGLVGVADLLAALDRPDGGEDVVELHDLVINR